MSIKLLGACFAILLIGRASAQSSAPTLKLSVFDPWSPDLRTTIVRDGSSLKLTQNDPFGLGRVAVLEKKKLVAPYTIEAHFAVSSSNECVGGLWLRSPGKSSFVRGVLFGLQPNQHLRRLLTFNGPMLSDVIGPEQFDSGEVWVRVRETQSTRIYLMSSDGLTWQPVLSEVPASMKLSTYGIGVENRRGSPDAPNCSVQIYALTETR